MDPRNLHAIAVAVAGLLLAALVVVGGSRAWQALDDVSHFIG